MGLVDPDGRPLEVLTEADETLVDRMADELRAMHGGPAIVQFEPELLLKLIGLLQLAARHPGVAESEEQVAFIQLMVEGAREYFAECPAVLAVIQRGEDGS